MWQKSTQIENPWTESWLLFLPLKIMWRMWLPFLSFLNGAAIILQMIANEGLNKYSCVVTSTAILATCSYVLWPFFGPCWKSALRPGCWHRKSPPILFETTDLWVPHRHPWHIHLATSGNIWQPPPGHPCVGSFVTSIFFNRATICESNLMGLSRGAALDFPLAQAQVHAKKGPCNLGIDKC